MWNRRGGAEKAEQGKPRRQQEERREERRDKKRRQAWREERRRGRGQAREEGTGGIPIAGARLGPDLILAKGHQAAKGRPVAGRPKEQKRRASARGGTR